MAMTEELKNKIRSLKIYWDTDKGDKIGEEFSSPCIEASYLYKRQTGDFTSNVLRVLNNSTIKSLINTKENECRIRYITHPTLTEEDKKILKDVIKNKQNLEEYLEKLMDRSVQLFLDESDPSLDRQSRLDIFAQLIAKKTILIKFAFSINPHALFHKKIGIFYFPWGDKLSFIGGNNDTLRGLQINNESFDTRQSWNERDLEIIKEQDEIFELAWNGKSPNYITRKLNLKTLDKIVARTEKFKNNKKRIIKNNLEDNNVKDKKPDKQDTWKHRKEAVEIFLEKKSGILEMATGTGKTWTALDIIGQLLDEKKINKTIIQMKGSDLIDQWIKEIKIWKTYRKENIRILKQNSEKKEQEIFEANFDNDNIDIIFVSQFFLPQLLKSIENNNLEKTLIIHDEIHNLPTKKTISKICGLQKNIAYKLGLSATVYDAFDKERDDRLFEEVGPIIFKFGLKEAIENGILVELEHQFLEYELTKQEKKDKIGWRLWREKEKQKQVLPLYQIEETFRIQISKINKLAINKLEVFDEFISNNLKILNKCFIFALEKDYGDRILSIIMEHVPEVLTYYDEHADRKNLEHFAKGDLKCIINCKMLSEGINLKSLSNIVLFSSEGNRELIQRLGRVLRVDDKNNPNKRALVIDFVDKDQMEKMDGADYHRYETLSELSKVRRRI